MSSDLNNVMKRATRGMNIQVQRLRCGSLLGAFKELLDYLGGKCDHRRVRKLKKDRKYSVNLRALYCHDLCHAGDIKVKKT